VKWHDGSPSPRRRRLQLGICGRPGHVRGQHRFVKDVTARRSTRLHRARGLQERPRWADPFVGTRVCSSQALFRAYKGASRATRQTT
jgi:hypothetical protein